jgi:hypothetical protein
MGLAEIESAIAQLPAKDFAELMAWIQEYRERVWGKQIENDLAAGRRDATIAKAEEECRPGLDEVYEILGRRFSSGEHDVAARHNEHQP